MMRLINFLLGFVTGVLMGASAVLLITPHSGTENQALLKTRRDELLAIGRQASEASKADLQARLINYGDDASA